MNKFKDRLNVALKNEPVNAFANRSGVSEGVLRKYLSGHTLPGLDNLIAIADTAGVNIEWLATGRGLMLIQNRGKRDIVLFKIFFEVYEDYEKKTGKPLSPVEKAWSMSMIFDFYWERKYLDYKDVKDLIYHEIETLHELLRLSNQVINSDVNSERAKERIRDFFKQLWNKDEGEDMANELIGSKILKQPSKGEVIKSLDGPTKKTS
jgi:transcriptional regulator with XRE-family HTH domain